MRGDNDKKGIVKKNVFGSQSINPFVTHKNKQSRATRNIISDCIKFHLRQTSECCYHKVHIQSVFFSFFITFQGECWLQIHYLKRELNPGCDSDASNRNGTRTYS